MKSLGFKNGVEWVELIIPGSDFAEGLTGTSMRARAREQGIELMRYGRCGQDSIWVQGPRLVPDSIPTSDPVTPSAPVA